MDSQIEVLAKAIIQAGHEVIDKYWPLISLAINGPMGGQEEAKNDTLVRQTRNVVITTRRGIRVVVTPSDVCFYGSNDMIRADWIEVPGLIACLRGAIVPQYNEAVVNPDVKNVNLELASGFGHSPTDSARDYIFTSDDAEDIVKGGTLINECPNPVIAGEIAHVMKVGPRKLFKYIENEIVAV